MERMVAKVTTRFFAVSEANRRLGVQLRLFEADRCTVIRSGIDVDAWRKVEVDVHTKRRQLGLDPQRPVVGMVAALKPQKAPLDFIRVAAKVADECPAAQFILIGGGELRKVVEAEVERFRLSDRFVLAGWRRDVPELLRCLDVFVLTSLWEGLPRVYLEARVSGVPMVGTKVDGAAEVIEDGRTGYLTEPGDITAMAQRVLHLLQNPDVARPMVDRARAIPEEFDIHTMVRQQEDEYERLLTGRTGFRPIQEPVAYASAKR
jgi:glycosyltransferase involved in cell wall biosynthesis